MRSRPTDLFTNVYSPTGTTRAVQWAKGYRVPGANSTEVSKKSTELFKSAVPKFFFVRKKPTEFENVKRTVRRYACLQYNGNALGVGEKNLNKLYVFFPKRFSYIYENH